jgi:prophage antirepressor-like protein
LNIKVENWNGHKIRFVWHDGEWWGVARDVCDALDIKLVTRALSGLPEKGIHIMKTPTNGGEQDVNIINEQNIYRLIFKSRKPEAEQFQDWVYNMLKELRQATGLEGFQIFRMLDKEHQKEAMAKLKAGLHNPVRVDFIKANTIANKAISNMYGIEKMVKKGDMSPDMLVVRQGALEDTVELMTVKEKYGLNVSVSELVYDRYRQ